MPESDPDGRAVVLTSCWACRAPLIVMRREAETWPSVRVDPERDLPVNVDDHGRPVEPSPEAVARSSRRAVCLDCAERYRVTGTFIRRRPYRA